MNKSIVITEAQIVETMDAMCAESLCPETHDAWETVKHELFERRSALAAPTAPATVAQSVPVKPLSNQTIESGWQKTFSTSNPYCPCDLKSFTKAVRWAEHALLATPAPSVAQVDYTPPYSNCKYKFCDLPGQCRSEGKCHHPAPSVAKDGWLPIETAPKDGTRIQLFDADRKLQQMIGAWKFDGWWSDATPSGKSFIWADATHWRELPAPPTEPKE